MNIWVWKCIRALPVYYFCHLPYLVLIFKIRFTYSLNVFIKLGNVILDIVLKIVKILLTAWCGTAVEHWPIDQEVMVQFPDRTHAWVVGSIHSRGHADGSLSMIIIINVSISPSSFFSEMNKNNFFKKKMLLCQPSLCS